MIKDEATNDLDDHALLASCFAFVREEDNEFKKELEKEVAGL